jgi:oxygen-independent coproporphyrinogen III oxidase
MAGIYLHIPFCRQACYYCDFHFSTNTTRQQEMVDAICSEIQLQRHYLGTEIVHSIYFGGGTPSMLTAVQLDSIISTLHHQFAIVPDAEITLEANPDDLTSQKLISLRSSGINRLSLGIQSFNDKILQSLNRSHTSQRGLEAYLAARETGFTNISVDLIYAIPGETQRDWQQDIDQAIQLHPEHISSYSLTIEEKTVFGRWATQGKLKPETDDNAALQLEMLVESLTAAGYEQYEVSNFARPGFYSQHNSSYWKQEPYLGIGPGAHSYNLHTRQFNIRNNHLYIRAIEGGEIPAEHEVLTRQDQINEYLLTTLRTQWGADLKLLRQNFDYNLPEIHFPYIKTLVESNLAVLVNDNLTLTKSGKLLADKIAADLFA